jgi:NAD(P)-dependent dehydrogenase (short-subunit alcohol dehydrogenase family)
MTEGAPRETGLPEDVAGIFRLDGQRAVVTGAASGLGKAIAPGFARFGADVACLDIDLAGAGETANKISDMGRESTAVRVDVRDRESVRSSAEEVRCAVSKGIGTSGSGSSPVAALSRNSPHAASPP